MKSCPRLKTLTQELRCDCTWGICIPSNFQRKLFYLWKKFTFSKSNNLYCFLFLLSFPWGSRVSPRISHSHGLVYFVITWEAHKWNPLSESSAGIRTLHSKRMDQQITFGSPRESKNHRMMGWKGPQRSSSSSPLPWAPPATKSVSRAGCPWPHPFWSWAPPGMGHPQPLWATCTNTNLSFTHKKCAVLLAMASWKASGEAAGIAHTHRQSQTRGICTSETLQHYSISSSFKAQVRSCGKCSGNDTDHHALQFVPRQHPVQRVVCQMHLKSFLGLQQGKEKTRKNTCFKE